jgi:hypothetical protein
MRFGCHRDDSCVDGFDEIWLGTSIPGRPNRLVQQISSDPMAGRGNWPALRATWPSRNRAPRLMQMQDLVYVRVQQRWPEPGIPMLGPSAEIVRQLQQLSKASYPQSHRNDSKKSVQSIEAYRSKDIPENAHHSTATVSGVHSPSHPPTTEHETLVKMVLGHCRSKHNDQRRR